MQESRLGSFWQKIGFVPPSDPELCDFALHGLIASANESGGSETECGPRLERHRKYWGRSKKTKRPASGQDSGRNSTQPFRQYPADARRVKENRCARLCTATRRSLRLNEETYAQSLRRAPPRDAPRSTRNSGPACAGVNDRPDVLATQRRCEPAASESVHDLHAFDVPRVRHDIEERAI